MEAHDEQIARMRQAYREAHERFARRLRDAPAEAVERAPADGGWSAAQIGWHVATVDARFAGLVSGERPGAQRLADDEQVRPWSDIAAATPSKLEAPAPTIPPPGARRDEVLALLAGSSAKMDAALAGLDEERGTRFAVKHPVLGTIALAQIGDWAAAHTRRHNAQAKRVLGV